MTDNTMAKRKVTKDKQ